MVIPRHCILQKPTNMLKETWYRDNDVTGSRDVVVKTRRHGKTMGDGEKHRGMVMDKLGGSLYCKTFKFEQKV